MTSRSKRKGDSAELEIARILTDQLGGTIRRRLGAGRRDDTGDLDGLAQTTAEVKNMRDIARAVNEGLTDCVAEQANAGTTFGVAFIRRPGGRWFAAMTIEQWCTQHREATRPTPHGIDCGCSIYLDGGAAMGYHHSPHHDTEEPS